jgi:hypothetical protein
MSEQLIRIGYCLSLIGRLVSAGATAACSMTPSSPNSRAILVVTA